jgi:hypothetical protein
MSETAKDSGAQEAVNGELERRVWIRYPCEIKSSCRPLLSDGEIVWAGKASNISCGGIALAAERRFERNTLLTLEMKHPGEGRSWSTIVRVVRVTPNPVGGWLLGCSFASTISDEEMQELLTSVPAKAALIASEAP